MSSKESRSNMKSKQDHPLVVALSIVDPILQLLTKSSGKPMLPLDVMLRALPINEVKVPKPLTDPQVSMRSDDDNDQNEEFFVLSMKDAVFKLAHRNVLDISDEFDEEKMVAKAIDVSTNYDSLNESNNMLFVGFNALASMARKDRDENLYATKNGDNCIDVRRMGASTKAAAKRRVSALKASLKANPSDICLATPMVDLQGIENDLKTFTNDKLSQRGEHNCESNLYMILGLENDSSRDYGSASYAGLQPARKLKTARLEIRFRSYISELIPKILDLDLFPENLSEDADLSNKHESNCGRRSLYSHQAKAITSILDNNHTIICTSTGSGKSLCFLIPLLASVFNNNRSEKTLLIFPTKALAQDQLSKLQAIARLLPIGEDGKILLRPACLDGDTPHQQRYHIANECNVILSNPDTLHAYILPSSGSNKKSPFRKLLLQLKYIIIDEAHIYEGSFGAHVSVVFSRLVRLIAICQCEVSLPFRMPLFIACSATLINPLSHFQSLIRSIKDESNITVVSSDDDGSPCGPKYFFTWNPEKITTSIKEGARMNALLPVEIEENIDPGRYNYRRHAADETARLMAAAIRKNVRCVAFCKTRNLVEWVYEKCTSELRRDHSTSHLVEKIESYRGGYSADARRDIEMKLFQNELLGVIGTNALELGVDIGGIDLTLHCGYPGSFNSLLQQAGRAGRGTNTDRPSFAVMICFNSPAEQYLWSHPCGLLNRGLLPSLSIPLDVPIVQGHLLCAAFESPLLGSLSAPYLLDYRWASTCSIKSDQNLFGEANVYNNCMKNLIKRGCIHNDFIFVDDSRKVKISRAHSSFDKPHTLVSMRSIEPLSYGIVDVRHPLQAGCTDYIRCQEAVMDIIPYSRVFYHAFPGSIITYRGRKYVVIKLQTPPAVLDLVDNFGRRDQLAAFVEPTNSQYLTRALSNMTITVIKQLECLETVINSDESIDDVSIERMKVNRTEQNEIVTQVLGGTGAVTCKRRVWGYSKLSPATRVEISRTEISLPPMEFDTNALWFETSQWSNIDHFDEGNHALSHAILAVSPLFVPCAGTDLDCDHSFINCSRILIYDLTAGGNGCSDQLWKLMSSTCDVLLAAVNLLSECKLCNEGNDYNGGCPGCIHLSKCLKFNEGLHRSAGIKLGKNLLEHMEDYFDQRSRNKTLLKRDDDADTDTPRKKNRTVALKNATDLVGARKRNIVVGRPSWPTDD